MTSSQITGSTLDTDLRLLASRHRRKVLRDLVHESTNPGTIDELVEYIAARSSSEYRPRHGAIRITLQHKDLPQLEEHGIIGYDPPSGDIQYQPHDRIETLLECCRGDCE